MFEQFFQQWKERIDPIFNGEKFPIEERIKQKKARYWAVYRAIANNPGKYGHDLEARLKDQAQRGIVLLWIELVLQKLITFAFIQAWRAGLFSVWILVLFLQYAPFIKGVRVRGKKNVRSLPYQWIIYAERHPSLLDPVLSPMVLNMPKMLIRPSKYFPWQTPNTKIMKDPFLLFGRLSPLIRVESDEKGMPNDGSVLPRILKQLEKHTFILFPEGTRSDHGREPRRVTASGAVMSSPLAGIGLLIYQAYKRSEQNPLLVVPVFIRGAERVFPIGKPPWVFVWNILFRHRIEIIFGRPIDFEWLYEYAQEKRKIKKEERKELYQKISEQVMDAIAALDE